MRFSAFLLILALGLGCVKDEGQVSSANSSGDSGGTGGGSLGVDPLASYAWHLENTGQSSFSSSGGAAGKDIKIKETHALGLRGKGVRIAVSDTGVDWGHEDLEGNELAGEHRNYVSDDNSKWRGNDPTPSDGEAHGTAVTGLVSALGWNGIGSRGVAPESKFAGFRFLFNYPGTTTLDSYLARYLDQMDGDFDIFNYSYGSNGCSFESEIEEEHEALLVGVSELRSGKGALYVQSAGNSYEFFPDCYAFDNTNRDPSLASPHKIVVGAVNASGVRSSYSTPGSGLWVSAPGGEYGTSSPAMISTDISGCNWGMSQKVMGTTSFNWGNHSLNLACNYTSIMNGTSSAAPVLSGVIALMLEANPNLTWREVKHILATTSDQVDYSPFLNVLTHPDGQDLASYLYDVKWTTNSAGFNFSNWYGFGRVNALAAVEMAKTFTMDLGTYETTQNPNSGSWYYDSGTLSLAIPDKSATGVSSDLLVRHNFIIEAVQVRLTTDHTLPGDLAVHLVSPNGTESRLMNINNYLDNTSLPADFLMLSNAFYGEEAYGTWRLKIYDGTVGFTGNLTNWKINIHGRRKTPTGFIPNMPGAPVLPATYGSATTTPTITFAHSSTFGIIRYEVSVGSTPGASDMSDWESIGFNTSFQVKNLRLNNLTTYYVNIRAVDFDENASLSQTGEWKVVY